MKTIISFIRKMNTKTMVWFAMMIIAVLVCLVGLARAPKTWSFDCEGEVYAEGPCDIAILDHISLPLGIYQVAIPYETDGDMEYCINASDSTVFSGGLKSNGTPFFNGYHEARFTVWLFESTDELKFSITSNGAIHQLKYGEITIVDTKQMWLISLTILVSLFFLLVVVIKIGKKREEGELNKETIKIGLGLLMVAIWSSLLFLFGRLETGADLGVHLERIESVVNSIRDGIFPIRLESFYPFGYGYAGGIFYCDIFLYIPAFFRILGFTVQTSYNIFGCICSFAGVMVAYECGKRIWGNPYWGLLFSAIYNLTSYKIFDSIIRGGAGTLTGFIFLPLLLYGYYLLFTEDDDCVSKPRVWITISVAYSGILCSHILTLEMSLFYTIAVFLIYIRCLVSKRRLVSLLKAFGATIILNLWFIIPFLDYYLTQNIVIKNVSARTIQSWGLNLLDYMHIAPFTEVFDEQSLYSPVLVAIFLIFIVFWIGGGIGSPQKNQISLAKVSVIFALISIVFSLNVFPWDFIQGRNSLFKALVSVIQYPSRFLSFAMLFGAVVCTTFVWYLWTEKRRAWSVVTISIIISILGIDVYYIEAGITASNAYRLYDNTQSVGYLSGAEYLIWEENYLYNYTTLRQWDNAHTSENVEARDYHVGDLCGSVYVENKSEDEGYAEFSLLYYKGYEAEGESGEQLDCTLGNHNVVRVTVPGYYTGIVDVNFISPFYWRIGEMCSLFGWIGIVFYFFRNRRKKIL